MYWTSQLHQLFPYVPKKRSEKFQFRSTILLISSQQKKGGSMKGRSIFVTAAALFVISCWSCSNEKPTTGGKPNEPNKASQTAYKTDSVKAAISERLTKADLAWYAVNTYGLDCAEVVSKGELTAEGYFVITCSNGKKLRVYPRKRRPPKITNINVTHK